MGNPEPLHSKKTFLELREKFDTDKEIANELDVSAPTVVYWKKKHIGKEQRETNGVYYEEHTGDGHMRVKIRDGPVVSEHALAALSGGADPYDLFDSSTHVHHLNKMSYDNRPDNVIVVDSEKHTFIHQSEEWARCEGLLTENTRYTGGL